MVKPPQKGGNSADSMKLNTTDKAGSLKKLSFKICMPLI